MIYITGDRHGDFGDIPMWCTINKTTKKDILIILGDAGINYYGKNSKDISLKEILKQLPITLFCIHGNHEMRPTSIDTYKETEFMGGIVYSEDDYPNILFAKDGEVYNFNGLKTLVCGGAYSVDKDYRLLRGWRWFSDEQPSEEIKKRVEEKCKSNNWNVDIMLTHTAPLKYEPREWFIDGLEQDRIDKSTEEWLDTIEDRLNYKKWYCGHYHGNKKLDKIQFMYGDIEKFYNYLKENFMTQEMAREIVQSLPSLYPLQPVEEEAILTLLYPKELKSEKDSELDIDM